MQGKKKFTEKLFTHFQLSDRVPQDNFYRRLEEVLNLQWLYKAIKNIMEPRASKALPLLSSLN